MKIGLTDLPKSGCAMAPPAPPGTTPLYVMAVVLVVLIAGMPEPEWGQCTPHNIWPTS